MPESQDLTPDELKKVMSLAEALYGQDIAHKSVLAAAEEVGVPPEYMARAMAMIRADNERQQSIVSGRWKAVGVRVVALFVIAGVAYGFWYFEVFRPAGSLGIFSTPIETPSRETLMMSKANAPPTPPSDVSLQPESVTLSLPATLIAAPMRPVNSGPGIVICEPVMLEGTDSGLGVFGAGCGRWLQFVVGGRGELGKTPVDDDIVQARSDLARDGANTELTPGTARLIGKALGASYIATGAIQGNAAKCVLTYTLWKLPSMTEAGGPFVLSGTEAQVCAELPGVASKLMAQLGFSRGQALAAPTSPILCDVGLAPSPAANRKLTADADNDPLAATMLLDRAASISPDVVEALYRASDNVSVLYAMAGMPSLITPRLTQALDVEQRRFPNNYSVACAQLRRFVYRQNIRRQIVEVQQLPACAPGNPWSYLRCAQTFSESADTIRQGRFSADIPDADMLILRKLYDGAETEAGRAARLLPNDPQIALEYSDAALFNNDEKTADAWIWKAMALAPNNPKPYWRALEMFQPKWTTGHRQDLLKVVAKVEANGHLFDQLCSEVVYAMYASGTTGDLFDKAEQRAEMVAKVRPVQGEPFIVPAPTYGLGKSQAAK